ncbi:hypothetical protein ACLOJK_027855 [Asimina triloba]
MQTQRIVGAGATATMMQQLCSAMARRMALAGQNGRAAPVAAAAAASWTGQAEVCGRGDKKTKKGKRFKGSYGNARPKRKQMIQRLKDKLEVPRETGYLERQASIFSWGVVFLWVTHCSTMVVLLIAFSLALIDYAEDLLLSLHS